MAEVYFPEDVDNLLSSLGYYRADVLADLLVISKVGPQDLDFCELQADGIWQYRRQIGPSRYAYLLFEYYKNSDCYIVLHGFRGGPEGTTKLDLRAAKRKRKAH